MSAKGDCKPGQKSTILAYVFWLFGGIFGVHHFYLRRDRHAFVWWTTLGGFGIGWFGEIFRIPRYVRDSNEDPKHMQELAFRMAKNKKVSGVLMILTLPNNQIGADLLSKEKQSSNFSCTNVSTKIDIWIYSCGSQTHNICINIQFELFFNTYILNNLPLTFVIFCGYLNSIILDFHSVFIIVCRGSLT